jgi:hypothetical protein
MHITASAHGLTLHDAGKLSGVVLVAFACLFLSAQARSAEFILGLTLKQSEVSVTEEDETRDLAVLDSSVEVWPAVSLRTKERYFRGGESNWGWFIETGIGYYDVDDGPDSQLDGYYAHVVPTIFYRWNSVLSTKLKYKLGLGAGPGWMTADGDVILTREEGQPVVDFDSSGVGLAAGIFYEMSYDQWLFQLKAYGPDHSIGDYDLYLIEYRFLIGRSFSF